MRTGRITDMPGADPKDLYNQIEPFIWYALAILLVTALRRFSPISERLCLAFVVAVFGTSDFFESQAWWTPWWLLVWKAACLVAMVALGTRIGLRTRISKDPPPA